MGEALALVPPPARGETDDEVTRQGREHAERDDGIHQHPLEKVAEVKSEIRGG